MKAIVTTEVGIGVGQTRRYLSVVIHFVGTAPSPETIRSGIGSGWDHATQEDLTRRLSDVFEARVVTVGHAGGMRVELDSENYQHKDQR